MNKIAIIDMGTNTFHLLVAAIGPHGYQVIHRDHEAAKIGMAGINEGFISESAARRALAAMWKFRQTIDRFGVRKVYAFGTSAFRNATNALTLAAEIKTLTGISVRILSGEEEADYIFEGVSAAISMDAGTSLVMDIGAGSVEFIIGSEGKLSWKQSFEIGGQRLLEKFQKHDPILSDEIQALDLYFEKMLGPLLDALEKFKPGVLIGSSGTFDTLSDIYCIRQGITRTFDVPEAPLSPEGFYEIYQELIRKSRDARLQIEGMIEMRVDMIVVSCCLIRFLLEKNCFNRIRVSSYSLKEGVLSKLASDNKRK